MTRQERSVRCEGRDPQPTWWLVYLISALAVAGIGLVELFVDGEGMREILESFAVIGGFGLIVLWRWMNRIALDLERRHL